MNIETLKYFVELAEAGSFYRAAERSFISQQGLNRAITNLESELDMKLVERQGRAGVRLTKRGEIFLKGARSLLSGYDVMIDEMLSSDIAPTDAEDRLAITTTFYPLRCLSAIPEAHRILGNVDLREQDFNQILEGAANATGDELFLVDIYPFSSLRLENARNLSFEPLFPTRLGLLCRDDAAIPEAPSIHREDVAGLPLALSSEKGVAAWVDWVFRDHVPSNVRLRTSGVKPMLDFVRAGQFSTFDSAGFNLIASQGLAGGLRFTPFATSDAEAMVGFLFNRNARLKSRSKFYLDRIIRLFGR